MLFAQMDYKIAKQRVRTGIAELFDLFQELRAVPAPGLPAFEDVGLVGVENASAIRWLAALRKGLGLEKLPHRVTRQRETARNLSLGDQLLMERADSLIARVPIRAADL